jgi:hypothetical protein
MMVGGMGRVRETGGGAVTERWADRLGFWRAKRVTPALHQTQCGASVVTGGNNKG